MNSLTNRRVSMRMPIQRNREVKADMTGYSGKRKLSASAQMPRQKRIMAAPTKNASIRLFQSSLMVGLCLKSLWRIMRKFYHILQRKANNPQIIIVFLLLNLEDQELPYLKFSLLFLFLGGFSWTQMTQDQVTKKAQDFIHIVVCLLLIVVRFLVIFWVLSVHKHKHHQWAWCQVLENFLSFY